MLLTRSRSRAPRHTSRHATAITGQITQMAAKLNIQIEE